MPIATTSLLALLVLLSTIQPNAHVHHREGAPRHGPCNAALISQQSSHVNCVWGSTYGCAGMAAVWYDINPIRLRVVRDVAVSPFGPCPPSPDLGAPA